MSLPFREQQIGEKLFLREFAKDTDSDELVWHQDREDRTVTIIKANGWKLQMDNKLPISLKDGDIYFIKAYEYHRIIKGHGKLLIEVRKQII